MGIRPLAGPDVAAVLGSKAIDTAVTLYATAENGIAPHADLALASDGFHSARHSRWLRRASRRSLPRVPDLPSLGRTEDRGIFAFASEAIGFDELESYFAPSKH